MLKTRAIKHRSCGGRDEVRSRYEPQTAVLIDPNIYLTSRRAGLSSSAELLVAYFWLG